MRLTRFLDNDDRTCIGDDQGDGTALEVLDPLGVLGPLTASNRRLLFQGKRAVIADDDENMRELMRSVLERVGCKTVTCPDGGSAIRAIEQEPFDLVVSDIVMPDRNGYEVFTAACAHDPPVPVLLVTGFGYDPSHGLVRASEEGHDAVLFKPFTPQDLLDGLEKAIRETIRSPLAALTATTRRLDIKTVLPPMSPIEIIGLGRMFDPAADEDESMLEVFLKPPTSVVGTGVPIRRPDFLGVDPELAAEGELAIVIGRAIRNAEEDEVAEAILGYTAANDLTARHWQTPTGGPRWMRGKGFDGFCPLGPVIVTADEAVDPASWPVRTLVNDTLIRDGALNATGRSPLEIVSLLSQYLTLGPGTIILTGGPPEITPFRPLGAGDRIVVEIEPIGRLVNPIEAG